MVEWDVLDDKPLPAEDEPAPRRPLPWRAIAVALIIVLAVTGAGVVVRYRIVREQLRADIQTFVTEEERALRFGVTERAVELADPDAPREWRDWYRSTFQVGNSELPPPVVTKVEQTGDRYLTTIEYRRAGQTYTSVRNYRLMTQGWRRTPITSEQWGEPQQAEFPSPFDFELTARDAEVLEAPRILQTLNNFRAAWDRHWPVGAETVEVRIVPTETLTTPLLDFVPNGVVVYARSPLLSQTPVFEPPTACSLGLIDGIAEVYSKEYGTANNGERLRATLRQSLTDYLLRTEEGLCVIGEEVRVQPDYTEMLGLPPTFDIYLIEHFGPEVLYTIARNTFGQSDIQRVIANATGYPYEALLYAIERNLPLQPSLTPQDTQQAISTAQVIARDGSDPIQFQVRFSDNTTATATAAETPFDACISLESEVTVARNRDQSISITRVLDRYLAPRLNGAPWPTTTRLIYTTASDNYTYLTAFTAEGGYQTLLATPATAELVPAPDGSGTVAYLTTDTCGWALNVYTPSSGRVERYTTMEDVPTRVLWVGNNPGVMYQEESEDGPVWRAYLLRDTQLQFYGSNRGRLLGYNFNRGMMVVFDEFALHFAGTGRDSSMVPLAFRFTANSEVSALSPNGRYLAYNVYPSDGRADLKVFDLDTLEETYLNTIPPSMANGESRWSINTDALPLLAVAGGELSGQSGMTIQTFTLDPETGVDVNSYQSRGEISGLQWCSNGYLTFHLTTETGLELTILDVNTMQARPLAAVGERVLWCP